MPATGRPVRFLSRAAAVSIDSTRPAMRGVAQTLEVLPLVAGRVLPAAVEPVAHQRLAFNSPKGGLRCGSFTCSGPNRRICPSRR
jgi:hypothetical protein